MGFFDVELPVLPGRLPLCEPSEPARTSEALAPLVWLSFYPFAGDLSRVELDFYLSFAVFNSSSSAEWLGRVLQLRVASNALIEVAESVFCGPDEALGSP
jgi:hypothetical protein